MYNTENERYASVHTSSLNEELGQIEFVFSDKTGTLTCNKMEFKLCVIGDVLYGDGSCLRPDGGPKIPQDPNKPTFVEPRLKNLKKGLPDDKVINFEIKEQKTGELMVSYKKQSDLVKEFFNLLSLCHNCVLEIDDRGQRYESESPDEIALVQTAKDVGYKYSGPSKGYQILEVFGKKIEIEQLVYFPFTSTRKRASVIVRHNGLVKLLSKGADSIIKDRLGKE